MSKYARNTIGRNLLTSLSSSASGTWKLDEVANYEQSSQWFVSTPTISYITYSVVNSSASQYTYSNIDVGTNPGTIVVFIGSESGSAQSITSVSIGGTSATNVISNSVTDSSANALSAIYLADNISGTISVVVNFSANQVRAAIGVYKLNSLSSTTATTTGTANVTTGVTSASTTLNSLSNNSVIIAGYTHGDIYTFTWSSGVTEDFEATGGGTTGFTGASNINASGTTTVTVTHTAGGGAQAASLVAAAWR